MSSNRAPVTRPGAAWREGGSVGLLLFGLFAQLTPFGSNTSFLASAAAFLDVACAIAILLLLAPKAPPTFWRALHVPALLFALAVAWAASGLAPISAQSAWTAEFTRPAGAAAGSLTPDLTILELAKLGGSGALVLSAAIVAVSRRRLNMTINALLAIGAGYAICALILYDVDPNTVFGVSKGAQQSRFTATLLNGNAAGCLFAVFFALTASAARSALAAVNDAPSGAKARQAQVLALYVGYLFVFAAACGLTRSRTDLACAVAAMLIVVLWPRGGEPRTARQARTGWIYIASTALLATSLIAGVVLGGGRTLQRTEDWREGVSDRFVAYRHIAEAIGDAPLRGYGLGSFATVNRHGLDSTQIMTVWNFGAAHDAALQALLEGGAPFLLLVLAVFGLLVARAVGSSRSSALWPMRRGVTAAGLTLLVCSGMDIALNVPAVAAFGMVLAGFVLGGVVYEPGGGRSRAGDAAFAST